MSGTRTRQHDQDQDHEQESQDQELEQELESRKRAETCGLELATRTRASFLFYQRAIASKLYTFVSIVILCGLEVT